MKRDASVGYCPFCRTPLPSIASSYGEAHCPRCDGRLWHLGLASGPTFFVRRAGESIYDLMASVGSSRHGFTAEDVKAILRDADAGDVAELLATLEDALRS